MAYRRTEKMQKRVENRRDSIIRAAEELFAEQGYDSTTMQQIAKKAGTSIGNMYFYFSNKEDVMFSLIDELSAKIWSDEFNPAHFPDEQFSRETIEAMDDYLKVHGLFSRETFTKSIISAAEHSIFRRHIIRFLEQKAGERYEKYDDFFEGLDRELSLSYHLGGLVNMFEKILRGELDRTPHDAGLFLARCKLQIRGIPEDQVRKTMAELERLIPLCISEDARS
ncbi:MAG: TetR/AcrR family transcriptional regulator [Balneolia bacterium]|nr:TetR/AcrR family transcriptional regulator [Balneolia bacterium]